MTKYVPWPQDPWNEIIPNLWMGGQIDLTSPGNISRVRGQFDAVYSFYWLSEEGNGGDGSVEHHHYHIPDGELDAVELDTVKKYAAAVATDVGDLGNKVLVRCQAGYNRSGLVVGLALLELGYSADDAINLIREKRSPYALHNEHFIRYIREAP